MKKKIVTKERGWIDLREEKPRICENILFTDGDFVYMGWLETHEPLEDLIFYNCTEREDSWPEGITHWMELPEPPIKNKGD